MTGRRVGLLSPNGMRLLRWFATLSEEQLRNVTNEDVATYLGVNVRNAERRVSELRQTGAVLIVRDTPSPRHLTGRTIYVSESGHRLLRGDFAPTVSPDEED